MASLQFAIEFLRDSNWITAMCYWIPKGFQWDHSSGWVWISAEHPHSILLVSAECQVNFWALPLFQCQRRFWCWCCCCSSPLWFLLTLLLWLGLNFRRVSAEYFIGFRRVPGRFMSPPSFSTPGILQAISLRSLGKPMHCACYFLGIPRETYAFWKVSPRDP